MNLNDLVCTFEQAKKLKELGVDEDSYFYWMNYLEQWIVLDWNHLRDDSRTFSKRNGYPAYTSAELGEIIAKIFPMIAIKCKKMKKPTDHGVAWYMWGDGHGLLENFIHWGDTEAQARAEFLIYLLEGRPSQKENK